MGIGNAHFPTIGPCRALLEGIDGLQRRGTYEPIAEPADAGNGPAKVVEIEKGVKEECREAVADDEISLSPPRRCLLAAARRTRARVPG